METEKIIDLLEERIKFHRESIERFKTYGRPMHEDALISNGQIMEDEIIICLLFEAAYEQKKKEKESKSGDTGGVDHGGN